ncbi:TPA_asm: coat protein [ssRNA phage SRR5467091_1]|uniref:Coat protein n=1 Tax=ssRNA phage SRR5467091_1 TaxID=2786459 RepID=A0A8S5L0E2_9VIRU|nr:coat protein [ssRNA phage SRR5467091_1]DAD50907.1 TPA_asm: coat protein [ssRNA phage SRR5467091_1]
MSIGITSPITGSAQTGLTSPTYTVANDVAPPGNPGKQVAVTALGGTQTGVTVHSVAAPFTCNFTRPGNLRVLGSPNPVTGVVNLVPMNTYKLITRKGVTPLAGQPIKVMNITTTCDVPAGADVADPANVRAAFSLHIGALNQQSAGFGDLAISGIL